MTLNEYRLEKVLTYADLGREIGVSRQTALNWCSGKSFPNRTNMKRILDKTNGSVSPASFYEVKKWMLEK